jgi:tetratricopeptide (TPR) repeat protein
MVHREKFGENNIRTAWVLVNLGNVYKDIGELDKAKDLLETCLTIYARYFGENHVQSARILSILGEVYLLKGDLDIAETLLNKALLTAYSGQFEHQFRFYSNGNSSLNRTSIPVLFEQGSKGRDVHFKLVRFDLLAFCFSHRFTSYFKSV